MTRPKMEYTSDYVMVPKTIQVPQIIKEKAIRMVPKETYETKIVAIQVNLQYSIERHRCSG
jgi:hypothetical protein